MSELTRWLQAQLRPIADPERAPQMAAYLKTDMPFYGISKPALKPVLRDLVKRARTSDVKQYRDQVLEVWALPHREEKYAALALARGSKACVRADQLDLYEQLVREGAWWDLVDEIAAHLVGTVWLNERPVVQPVMANWSMDPDLWIRRTAVIGQLRHKRDTDAEFLFRVCLEHAHETDFFMRKAIGWALRQYGDSDPDAVVAFLRDHGDALSGLSLREASRKLVASGKMSSP